MSGREMARWRVVYDAVRTPIAEGNLRPGEKVPAELDLARHFGFSRQTVRTALIKLAEEGWITSGGGSRGRRVIGPPGTPAPPAPAKHVHPDPVTEPGTVTEYGVRMVTVTGAIIYNPSIFTRKGSAQGYLRSLRSDIREHPSTVVSAELISRQVVRGDWEPGMTDAGKTDTGPLTVTATAPRRAFRHE